MLAFAWDFGPFVSTDAMSATGLTRSTTIEAFNELIAIGLLRELPNARHGGDYQGGRPARRVEFRADAAVVVGVDAGLARLSATVADLRGAPLARRSIELDDTMTGADDRRVAILAAIDSALSAAGRDRSSVLAVCVGVPAPVDARGQSPQHWDDFWRRMNPGLLVMLEEWAPIVRVDNDASLAAVAELAIGSAVGCSDFVVLLAGDRFGAGVVIDGHLLRGAHGGVGETVAFDHVVGVESACGIGLQLTEWVRQAAAAGELPDEHPFRRLPTEQLTGRAVLELAADGDAWSYTLVTRAGVMLGRIAAVLGSLYDPSRIIVAGAVADGLAQVVEVARGRVADELDLPAPELVLSSLGATSVVTGAVFAAIEAAKAGVLRQRTSAPGPAGPSTAAT